MNIKIDAAVTVKPNRYRFVVTNTDRRVVCDRTFNFEDLDPSTVMDLSNRLTQEIEATGENVQSVKVFTWFETPHDCLNVFYPHCA